MKIQEISKEEYDSFLAGVFNYSFLQSSEMRDVLKASNNRIKLLALKDEEKVLAVGLAMYRKILWGQRMDLMVGASAKEKKYEYLFYKHLKDYVKSSRVLKLVIKLDHDLKTYDSEGNLLTSLDEGFSDKMRNLSYLENDGSVSSYDGFPDWHYIKDLSEFMPSNFDGLLKSFNKNAQRKIKKAADFDINVRAIGIDELEEFKSVTADTASRQDFSDKSIQYYNNFYKSFGDNCDFLTAEINFDKSIAKIESLLDGLDEKSKKNAQRIKSLTGDLQMLKEFKKSSNKNILTLANMILVYQKNEVIYFLGGSLSDYQKLPGPFVLQYEAMKRSMNKGLTRYNFFGIDGSFDGSDGVLRFKQNFNGYIVEKPGAFIYYPNPRKYKMTEFLKTIKEKLSKLVRK